MSSRDLVQGGEDPGCLIFIGHFPHMSPMIHCSVAERDLQLEESYGSSPPSTRYAIENDYRSDFPQRPMIDGSFAERDLQLEES